MGDEQWSDDEWKQFEARFENVQSDSEMQELLNLTIGQWEHPEWYDSPCLCQLCMSYGD